MNRAKEVFKMSKAGILVVVTVLIALTSFETSRANSVPVLESLLIKAQKSIDKNGYLDKLNPFDYILFDLIPRIAGQEPSNMNGSRSEFKDYVMSDTSNDDAAHLTQLELILRSGFKYETYDAIADDGYVTQLTRIINPLANRKYLRQPPILMEHGGTIDPTAYLIGSSIQHYPEKFPRTAEDGPITSWNRSLAFVLANNGFDVFLAETRGSNDQNKRRVASRVGATILGGRNARKNMTTGENIHELLHQNEYWDFSQDDIIAHELKSHIDKVLEVTGSKKLSFMTFSLSTPTSLAFLGTRPDYATKIEGYVSMAPIISGEGVNKVIKMILQGACPMMPDAVGTLLITDTLFTQPMRDLVITLSASKHFRYSVLKSIVTLLMGPSAKYQTLLDLNVLGHMLRRLSFKEAKQLCQQTKSNKLQKYDYGPIENKLMYGTVDPPVYDLSDLKIKDWIVVSGANDALATLQILDHLVSIVNPKPSARILAPGLNHLDLIAGFENDKYVNLPILAYFESKSYIPGQEDSMLVSGARSFDVRAFLPRELHPLLGAGKARDFGEVLANMTKTDPAKLFETFQQNLKNIWSRFGELIPNKKKENYNK